MALSPLSAEIRVFNDLVNSGFSVVKHQEIASANSSLTERFGITRETVFGALLFTSSTVCPSAYTSLA